MNRIVKTLSFRTISPLAALALLAASALSGSARAEGYGAGGGEHGSHDYHAGLFAGVTINEHDSAMTLGADYEYRFSHDLGVIGLIDLAFFDEIVALYGVGLTGRFIDPVRILVAPAVEIAAGETAFALRGGLAYDFHVGSMTISPTANFDLVHSHVSSVLGLTFGMGF